MTKVTTSLGMTMESFLSLLAGAAGSGADSRFHNNRGGDRW